MALKPITVLIAALKGMALPAVAPARIGEITPKLAGDLPTLRLVASELAFSPLGIGGSRFAYLDAGDNPVEDRGRRINGILNLEVWGADEDAVNALAMAAAEGLAGAESALLGKGFLRLRQSRWLPAEDTVLKGTGAAKALKQTLAFEIVFEDIETAPVREGLIKEIDVRIRPPVEEGLDIK
jgi:hypothetical protein